MKIKASKKHYTAHATIVWCFDHRFSLALRQYIKKNGIREYDLICVAGGAKSLSSPEAVSHRDFILDQIGKSIRLHDPKKIMLMTHSDCGAYGGLKKFDHDAKKEKSFHHKELVVARKVLAKHLGDVRVAVESVFADFERLHRV